MIIGIGVDLVDVKRFEAIIYRWKHRFLQRIFTDEEIRYCNNKKNPAQRFATRFAAKEAYKKALFPKGAEGVKFKEIEIDQRDNRPVVNLYGRVREIADGMKIANTHMMVSHDGNYGIANVVLESK